jgi:hypothetical protein
LVLKGISKSVGDEEDSLLGSTVETLGNCVGLFFDAVAAFHAILEADQATVWILTFYCTHRWRDLVSFQYGNSVACCINLRVDFGIVVGSVYRRPILLRPPALVLRPHPAGLRNRLAPFGRCVLLRGGGPLGCDGLFGGNGRAQVGVVLLPVAGLSTGVAGPVRPAAAVILVVSVICVPVW